MKASVFINNHGPVTEKNSVMKAESSQIFEVGLLINVNAAV